MATTLSLKFFEAFEMRRRVWVVLEEEFDPDQSYWTVVDYLIFGNRAEALACMRRGTLIPMAGEPLDGPLNIVDFPTPPRRDLLAVLERIQAHPDNARRDVMGRAVGCDDMSLIDLIRDEGLHLPPSAWEGVKQLVTAIRDKLLGDNPSTFRKLLRDGLDASAALAVIVCVGAACLHFGA